MHWTLLLMTLGLFGLTPDATIEATVQPAAWVADAATPATLDAPHTDLFRRGGDGLPLMVPTTSLYICDLEDWNPCDPGCLCIVVRNEVQCRC
ncbi:MAG: hypothetical protein AAGC60_00405 [Acidobacteriota bacterium]